MKTFSNYIFEAISTGTTVSMSGTTSPTIDKNEVEFTKKMSKIIDGSDRNVSTAKEIYNKVKTAETKSKEEEESSQKAQAEVTEATDLTTTLKNLNNPKNAYVIETDTHKIDVNFEKAGNNFLYAKITAVDPESKSIEKFKEEQNTTPYIEIPIKLKFNIKQDFNLCKKSSEGNYTNVMVRKMKIKSIKEKGTEKEEL
jgi:vacuolar-type H+-ATPase subunit I/STV1